MTYWRISTIRPFTIFTNQNYTNSKKINATSVQMHTPLLYSCSEIGLLIFDKRIGFRPYFLSFQGPNSFCSPLGNLLKEKQVPLMANSSTFFVSKIFYFGYTYHYLGGNIQIVSGAFRDKRRGTVCPWVISQSQKRCRLLIANWILINLRILSALAIFQRIRAWYATSPMAKVKLRQNSIAVAAKCVNLRRFYMFHQLITWNSSPSNAVDLRFL